MTSTNIKSDRTQMRHCKEKKLQEGKGESQRDEIFELVKEIVSVERRKGKGVGVHCERQIVGAHVVEVAQVPGALLFHGSHRLSVKTAQPCRQLCSGGCGGERRGPLFSISLLISISVLISLPARRISIPSKFPSSPMFVLFIYKSTTKETKALVLHSTALTIFTCLFAQVCVVLVFLTVVTQVKQRRLKCPLFWFGTHINPFP